MEPGFGPPPSELNDRFKVPRPKNLREIPEYLRKTVGGTAYRLLYIFRLVWETKPWMMISMACLALAGGILPLAGAYVNAYLLKQVVLSFSQSVNLILPLALQFGYLFLVALITNLNNMVIQISGEAVSNHVKVKIMKKARQVDISSFDMPDFYERLENANREAGHRPINILRSTFDLASKIISMVSFFAVLIVILPQLPRVTILYFIAFLALTITSATVSFYFRRKNFAYMFRRSKDRRQLNYYSDLLVNKDMVKEVRLFDLSDLFIGRYNKVFSGYFKGIRTLVWHEGFWNILLTLLTAVMNAILFYMIATNVSQIDDYSLYTGALNSISTGLATIITTIATIYEGSLFIDNMILFMKEKPQIVPTVATPIKPHHGIGHTIELRDVSFRYSGSHKDVIHKMNLTFNAGETVALVGLNGAGKTTLIKLITRLYDPTEGIILLDGKDIREYDIKELYSLYGIIFQDFGKYAVSVGDNIAFGNIHKDRTEKALSESARQAGADKFIDAMPKGYDTPLMRYFEPDGKELSIGQWQKLSVARAFYSDADILILDEPTASLDAIAEQEIYNQFDMLRSGRTSVFVSHRLSSATTADRVIVLENGMVVEEGTHAALMQNKGAYYKLFSTQAARYQEKKDAPPDMFIKNHYKD